MPRPHARHVVARDDGWAVVKEGASRASSIHDRKADAVKSARQSARKEGVELVVHNKDGKIGQKDSHGRDPRQVKG